MYKKLLLVALFTISTSLHADVKPLLSVGFDAGGDDLATVTYTTGDKITIKSGNGLFIEGGIANIANKLETQLVAGYKVENIKDASNGDADFSRFYVSAIQMYNLGKISVGGGLTYHLKPKLSSSGAVSAIGNHEFDNALGGVIQGAYNFNQASGKGLSVGLRATVIDYKLKQTGKSVDSNSVGIYLSNKF